LIREEKEFFAESWVTKDCDSRMSWIGGEGLPFRDQVKEKREHRKPQVGFNRANPQERVEPYGVFCTVHEVVYMGFSGYMFVYMGFSGYMFVYMGLLKEIHVHLENHAIYGSYNRSNFVRFVCSCIYLSWSLTLL
jgi:hypothetical protein